MIHIEYLQVHYHHKSPVLSIDRLRIGRGERVAVIGPSGAGKSTLLRSIKGYVRPSQGKIEVMGVNPWTARRRERRRVGRRIGLIYQQFHLAPRLSVMQNVLCGRLGMTSTWRSLLGSFSPEDHRACWSAICEVGLVEQVHQRADSLSGGERQRVAVARVLAQEPSIILADEPVSSLDPAWAEDVLKLITEIQTHHDYRRRGLASATAAAMIEHCLDAGLEPCWDAHNSMSAALATKIGFVNPTPYTAYELAPDAQPL